MHRIGAAAANLGRCKKTLRAALSRLRTVEKAWTTVSWMLL